MPPRAIAKVNAANDDQKVGMDIVRRALLAPVRQIAENSGTDGSVRGRQAAGLDRTTNFGYDAQMNEFTDLVKAGINRSGEGRAHRPAGRGVDRRPSDHDRGHGRGQAGRDGEQLRATPAY